MSLEWWRAEVKADVYLCVTCWSWWMCNNTGEGRGLPSALGAPSSWEDTQLLRPLSHCLLLFQISHLQIYIKKGKLLCGTVCPNTSNCGFCQSLHNITSMYYSGLDSMSEQSKIILPNHEKELNTVLLIACMHWFCCLALCKYKLSPPCMFSNDSHCSHCSSSTCLHLFLFFLHLW